MTTLIHRPISRWPGELTPWASRRVAPFRSSYATTLVLLQRELDALGATRAVLQLAIVETDLRTTDGMPRASAKPKHPGVIVTFISKHGPLQYATDEFTSWQDNLRAIALGLEALRKVERYGITRSGEQYTGFRALPGFETTMTLKVASCLLAHYSTLSPGQLLQDTEGGSVRDAYRAAAKVVHPDRGGDHEEWLKVEEAYRLLMAS